MASNSRKTSVFVSSIGLSAVVMETATTVLLILRRSGSKACCDQLQLNFKVNKKPSASQLVGSVSDFSLARSNFKHFPRRAYSNSYSWTGLGLRLIIESWLYARREWIFSCFLGWKLTADVGDVFSDGLVSSKDAAATRTLESACSESDSGFLRLVGKWFQHKKQSRWWHWQWRGPL